MTDNRPLSLDEHDNPSWSTKKKYTIDRPGAFIIIENSSFNYQYQGHIVKDLTGYEYDTRNILTKFDLYDGDYTKPNVLYGKNLVPVSPEGTPKSSDETFEEFMEEVWKIENPSFLMVFVMSHGDADGNMLLAKGCIGNDCLNGKHAGERGREEDSNQCVRRNIQDKIIRPIQEFKSFLNVPKIFILQTCRGTELGVDVLGAGDSEEVFTIPKGSDTLILYATNQNYKAWVEETKGSLLISSLLDQIDKVKRCDVKSIGKSLAKVNSCLKEEGLEEKETEDLVDGWMMPVFEKTVQHVARDLGICKAGGELPRKVVDKQQPEISSTLIFQLSCLDILHFSNEDVKPEQSSKSDQ